jgi:transposase, IS5 family
MMGAIMSERNSKKPGIADYVAARRKRMDCFLDEIDRLIDWKPLEKCFAKNSSALSMPSATRRIRLYPCL